MSILYSELGYKAICCEIQSVYSCITKVIKCYAENCCSEVNNNIYIYTILWKYKSLYSIMDDTYFLLAFHNFYSHWI